MMADILLNLIVNFGIGLLIILAINDRQGRLINWVFDAPYFVLTLLAIELWPLIIAMEAYKLITHRR